MVALTDLLAQLSVHVQNEDHERVYLESLDHLKRFPTESIYLKQCLIALIKSDKFGVAEKLLKKYSGAMKKDPESLVVEQAYIFYQLGKSKELHELSSDRRAFKHILAQDYYKNGDNLKALKIYQSLIKTNDKIDSQLDLGCNERAVISQYYSTNPPLEKISPMSLTVSDSYDQIFNNALIEMNTQNYSKALELLKESEKKCQEANHEIPEEELFSEIAPIRIQIAYVHELLGNKAESQQILESFDLPNINDKMIKLICFNNLLSVSDLITEDVNANLLSRELDFPDILNQLKDKLTVPQLKVLERNHLLLSFNAGKDISSKSRKYTNKFPGSLLPQALNSAHKAGIELLDNDCESNARKITNYYRNNGSDIGAALLAAHLNITIKNYDTASLVLWETLSSAKLQALAKPGVVGAMLAIYDFLNNQLARTKILNGVYDLYLSKEITDISQYDYIKDIAFKILASDEKKAITLFDKLNGVHEDPLVSQVLSLSSDKLLPVSALVGDLSVDKLINDGVQPLIKKTSKIQAYKIKKPRSRKPKLPKTITEKIENGNKDAAAEGLASLDKERWIPLKHRSYYKPKKGKKLKDVQGGAADNNTEMNLSSSVNSTSSSLSKSKNAKKIKKKGKR